MIARMRLQCLPLMAALFAIGFATGGAKADEKISIVATTGMIADAVKQVGGERVSVTALMGPGVDPHTYRQTRSDIAAMIKAKAVFWHGLYLEAQLEDFLRDLGKKKTVVALAESLPKEQLLSNKDYPGRYDPHVWMDPRLWKGVVVAARDALIALDPDGADTFKANADRHLAEIDTLATYSDKAFATVPEGSRVLVTAHDAFGYFGKAYGYEVLGIQGISTESEAGLKQIEALVDIIVQKKISAIFVESSVSDRNVRALIEGAGAKGHTVVIGGELYSDAMGAPGTYEGTYIGMIDHNATVITRALGGEAPERGLNNKLAALQSRSKL
ncbi:zinc ABC transporter substrate-binding protein [Hyphomicrobium sp. CS1GBMeth3]|uniref:metal ABC transporter solute-binding protein, Zn/Mn family n=1 Tax=Hyphomicrobium sp. CS1GBMeth3 TaxID=1892845 RepID=UPI000A714B7C|nr:zinc ABC transporter substrate-binding protein [Hyphomicrobium sp. CS1GBMeth3]